MGILRALLAISVIFSHTYGNLLVGGQAAVQLFYMISGFLISYILIEEKKYIKIYNFYINRYLRIFPIYFTMIIITMASYILYVIIFGKKLEFFDFYSDLTIGAIFLLIISNILLFMQDWLFFLGINENNSLRFIASYGESNTFLFRGLIIPQSWTLGLELTFYLIAPYILNSKLKMFGLLVTSILVRFYLINLGIGRDDPWTYRFFPNEVALFLFGSISHQILLPMYEKIGSFENKILSIIITYVVIAMVIVFPYIAFPELIKILLLYSIFFLLMPFFFKFQAFHKYDKKIGELSYPIYIVHILVMSYVFRLSEFFLLQNKLYKSIIVVVISIFAATLLNVYIARPIERLRKKYKYIGNN